MRQIDVFNGDADGLCALQQLRLAEPADSVLVTGVKRDIALLERVSAGAGDLVTVLDVSLDTNRQAWFDCWRQALGCDISTTTSPARFPPIYASNSPSTRRPWCARARWSTDTWAGAISPGPQWRPSATGLRW